MRRYKTLLLTACAAMLLITACARVRIPEPEVAPPKDYYHQLPAGAAALRKITDPSRIPDFKQAFNQDRETLLYALENSLRYLGYPSSRNYYPVQGIKHERALASLIYFRSLLFEAQSANEFHERILASFDVYESVGCDNKGTVLFTGYYTPIFAASLIRTDQFKYPIHRLPPDLVKHAEGTTLGRRVSDGAYVPYYSRGEVMSGALRGNELAYLADPFEAYICTVQGSAQLRLPDGTLFKIGYAGNNGKEYTSVGNLLIAAGLLAREQLSLAGLMDFFKQHPQRLSEYLPRNERYVFFQETDAEPTGSLNAPVTPYCSLATDKSLFPRACLTFVDTRIPSPEEFDIIRQRPFRQFLLDQDTGGAIRAPGRADIYLGIGDRAGRIAGWTLSEGRLYYLFLKD